MFFLVFEVVIFHKVPVDGKLENPKALLLEKIQW